MTDLAKSFSIGIKEIKFIDFSLTSAANELKEPEVEKFEFQFQIQTQVVESTKTFDIILKILISYKTTETINIELGHIETFSSFFITEFDEVVKKEAEVLTVPETIFPTTIGVAISTARGMLVMLLKDTNISRATIPIVNAQQFAPQKNKS